MFYQLCDQYGFMVIDEADNESHGASALSDYITATYEVSCDGVIVDSGKIEKLPAVAPHCDGTLPLSIEIPEKGRCYLKISYKLKNATEILPEGFDLGFDEVKLNNADDRNQTALQIWKAKPVSEESVTTTEGDRYITISTKTFTYK